MKEINRHSPLSRFFILLIDLYRFTLGGVLPPSCRFHPTCSEYAREAFGKYGLWRGALKSLSRLLRCHPFHPGGYDPLI
ncbi:MAG: membrane protein insertion efficiency factor YidD [Candidatus Zixiibacteriota bacterium]